MKKVVSIILSLALLISICTSAGIESLAYYDGTYNGFNYDCYDENDDENEPFIQIVSYTGENATVTIPNEINNIPVKQIWMGAFQFNDTVKKIVVPKNVDSIGQGAFASCEKLTEIVVDSNNENYKSINGILFSSNNVLVQYPAGKTDKKYVAPEYVTAFDSFAFQGANIEEIDMCNAEAIGVWFDGYALFEDCKRLKKATVNNIGPCMFEMCGSLNTVIIKKHISGIDMDCFKQCASLEHIYYVGTKSEWISLEKEYGDEEILYATIHCSNGNILPRLKRETLSSTSTEKVTLKTPKATTIKKLEANPNAFTVHVNKQTKNVSGYRLQYTTDKKFKKNIKTKIVKGAKNVKVKISGLKGKTKYYVRVATYYEKSGKRKYSKNSKALSVTTKLAKIKASTLKIDLSKTKYVYDGKAHKPKVTVKAKNGKTVSAKNYTVSYSKGRKNVGKYTVTIKFKGNYTGTVKKAFTIIPKGTSIKISDVGYSKFKVKWKKGNKSVKGYEIQYSKKSNFKNGKTKTVKGVKATNTFITGLPAKEKATYYVRIRTVNGKIKSNWSSAKKVTIKKQISLATELKNNYSDSLFDNAATVNSGKLAKCSATLSYFAYNQKNVRQQLNNIGFDVIWQGNYGLEKKKEHENKHHVAFTVAKRQVKNGPTIMVVVIRGTEGNEWISNGNIGGKKATFHYGFNTAKKEVLKKLKTLLAEEDKTNTKLWITGHSRGAAVANLLAADINKDTTIAPYIPYENVYCYTYACPNVSTSVTANKNIFNYVNYSDFVPTVPLRVWGFKRNGIDVFYSESENKVTSSNNKITKKVDSYTIIKNKCPSISNKPYISFTEKNNEDLVIHMLNKAPTLNKYYSGSANEWFEGIMKKKAKKPWGEIAVLASSLTNGDLAYATELLLDQQTEIGNSHDMTTYYAWVSEMYK